MTDDFLERLAELEVAAPPAEFDRQLHERLNRSLLIHHFVDLAVRAVPWALGHFSRAVVGFVIFSITGRFKEERKQEK